MKRINTVILLLLHLVPAGLAIIYFLGFGGDVLAGSAMFGLIFLNIFCYDRIWVSVVAMLSATALCVIASRASTQLYFQNISSDSMTITVGNLGALALGVFGVICAIVILTVKLLLK